MSATTVFGLYLSNDGEVLRSSAGNLLVETEDQTIQTLPLESIESVIAGANAKLSSAAAAQLRAKGVGVSFIDWQGRLQGRLEPALSTNALIRRAQVRTAEDENLSLALARCFVDAKIRNQRVFLLRVQRKRGLDLQDAIDHLEALRRQLGGASSRLALMGYEGEAARHYFQSWPLLLEGSGFLWSGRSRRPPKDPINALLSFGYSIATARCVEAAAAAGLDPYVGFLHAERQGRPELGLDLVEEFRTPWIDSLVLSLIGRKQIALEHFEESLDGGCLLTQPGRKIFFAAFSKLMNKRVMHPASQREHAFAQFPIIQARLLGKVCYGELPRYQGFVWR